MTTTPPSSNSGDYKVIAGGSSGTGSTTRYWDCCKSSCSWPGKASVNNPVDVCAKNGITLLDSNTASGCGGGGMYYALKRRYQNIRLKLICFFSRIHV